MSLLASSIACSMSSCFGCVVASIGVIRLGVILSEVVGDVNLGLHTKVIQYARVLSNLFVKRLRWPV